MAIPEIHVGNIGTSFRLFIVDQANAIVDLTGFTTIEIRFRKPDRTTVVIVAAALFGPATDGVIEFVTIVAGDLDVAGGWKHQGRVVIPSGTFWTEIVSFDVKDNL